MKKGYTLIELLIAIALMTLLLAVVTDNLKQFLFSRTKAAEILEFSAAISSARAKALSGDGDKSYKVVFAGDAYTLEDEDNVILTRHEVSQFVDVIYSTAEIEFEQVSGRALGCDPECTVEFRLQGEAGGLADFVVNSQGIIYEN